MLQQTQFDSITGLPRYGCMFMDLVLAAWLTAENREPNSAEVMRIYGDCLGDYIEAYDAKGQVAGTKPILEMVDHKSRAIWINNPSAVLQKALSYCSNGWRGRQYPDLHTTVPQYQPRNYKLTYTLLNFRRPSEDGHWVLADRSGRNIIYDPDESLQLDYWNRSPAWRGVQIWRL